MNAINYQFHNYIEKKKPKFKTESFPFALRNILKAILKINCRTQRNKHSIISLNK